MDTSAQIRCGYVSAGKVRIRQQRQGKDTILQRYSTDTHVDWNKAPPPSKSKIKLPFSLGASLTAIAWIAMTGVPARKMSPVLIHG